MAYSVNVAFNHKQKEISSYVTCYILDILEVSDEEGSKLVGVIIIIPFSRITHARTQLFI